MVVSPVLSDAERDRAILAAATDPRLAATLTSSYGMTQALAAAPELINRWEAAPDRHTWALIAAAADARRVGVRSPLPADLLRAAIPGYLTPTERARAPVNWFETALTYATTELHGAAAVLAPVANEMGTPAAYTIADYVYQHALRTRRTAVPPETAWTAYAEHLADSTNRLATADAAQKRKLYRHAERLYRSAGPVALPALALLQHRSGRTDDAEKTWRTAIANTGDPNSRIWLATILASRNRIDEAEQVLRDAIRTGVVDGHSRLGSLLADWGRLDEAEQLLRDGIAGADPDAWFGLAEVLKKKNRLDEAEQVLREAIVTGRFDESAGGGGGPRYWLTVLLRDQGRHEDAERVCRDSVAAGVPEARYWLATQLTEEGRLDEAEQVWRDAVTADEQAARYRLSWLLLDQDRVDETLDLWRDAITSSQPRAHTGMASVLETLGRTDEAEQARRDAIAASEPNSRSELARFLENQGRVAEAEQLWREAIAAGEQFTGLVSLLKKLGRPEEARQIECFGLNPDGSPGDLSDRRPSRPATTSR
jgi:tetratricopeptide (TPR) repeat protein